MLSKISTSTDNYVKFDCGGFAHLLVCNDAVVNALSFSLDGLIETFRLSGEESVDLKDSNIPQIYVRSFVPANPCAYRLLAYGKQSIVYPSASQKIDAVNAPYTDKNLPPTITKKISLPLKEGV